MVPYNRDIADQRRKYGDSMLRKGDEHIAMQQQHEAEMQAKLETARRKRQEEKDRQEALEVSLKVSIVLLTQEYAQRQRMEEIKRAAEKLAEERRLAREQAMEWTREVKMESDEERERKPKKPRKPKAEGGSGDEGEPKKKRRGKLRKNGADVAEPEDQAMFSEEEEVEKPKKVSRGTIREAHEYLTDSSAVPKSVWSGTKTRKRTPGREKSSCELLPKL